MLAFSFVYQSLFINEAHNLQEIEALISCHTEHALAKFIGKCNQQKWDLDACFKREKAIKRYYHGR